MRAVAAAWGRVPLPVGARRRRAAGAVGRCSRPLSQAEKAHTEERAQPSPVDRAAPPLAAMSAATTISGSIAGPTSSPSTAEARLADRRSADGRIPPLTDEARHAERLARRTAPAEATRRKRRRLQGANATTIRSSGRSANVASSASARRPVRRRCRTTSTTTSSRSCRRRTRDDPQRDGARRAHHPHERAASAADASASGWAIDRPLGRRHAGRRHHELHRQDAVPRLQRATCTSSSASRGSTPRHCSTSSRSRTRRRGRGRGPANTRGRRPTTTMYEYACHEGNYAMGNILRGARAQGS